MWLSRPDTRPRVEVPSRTSAGRHRAETLGQTTGSLPLSVITVPR